jgi:hypothetical protein
MLLRNTNEGQEVIQSALGKRKLGLLLSHIKVEMVGCLKVCKLIYICGYFHFQGGDIRYGTHWQKELEGQKANGEPYLGKEQRKKSCKHQESIDYKWRIKMWK